MKKIVFFLAVFLLTLNSNAQENENLKIADLLTKAISANDKQKDSILVELVKIEKTTSSKEIKDIANKAINTLVSIKYSNQQKNDVDKETILSISEQNTLEKKNHYVKARGANTLAEQELKPSIVVKEDKFQNRTIITSKYGSGIAKYCYPYIVIVDKKMYLHFFIRYSGKEGILFNTIRFSYGDNERYTYKDNNTKTGVVLGGVVEISDVVADEEFVKVLYRIAELDGNAEIQLSGQYDTNFKIGFQNRKAIRDIMELYEKLRLDNVQ